MRFSFVLFFTILAINTLAASAGQDSNLPDLSGFTKSPTEHQIVVVDRSFRVRSVEGMVVFQNKSGEPLEGVLFEIRGPDIAKTIRRTTTDKEGRFKIKAAPEGVYTFKTTRDGYNSSVGTIVVSKQATSDRKIRIAVAVGY